MLCLLIVNFVLRLNCYSEYRDTLLQYRLIDTMAKKEESRLPQAGDFQLKEGSVVDATRKYSYFDLVSGDSTSASL